MLETLFLWFGGAFIVTGLMQWLKGVMPIKSKAKRYIFSFVGAILAFVAAYFGGGFPMAYNALGIWASSQLGWDMIVQVILKRVKGE